MVPGPDVFPCRARPPAPAQARLVFRTCGAINIAAAKPSTIIDILNIPKDLIVASRIQSHHWIRILQTGKIISASRLVVGDELLSCRGGDACRRVSSELLYR